MRGPATGGEPVRYVTRTAIVFLVALAAAAGLYKLYGTVFPFSRAPLGICRHCGARTAFIPGGWAPFCPAHTPLFGILQAGMIMLEALFLLAVAVSFWMFLREVVQHGGWSESTVLAVLCLVIAVMFLLATPNRLTAAQRFSAVALYMIYVLSALFIDRMESLMVMLVVAVALSAAVALIVQIAFWVLVGYRWI